VNEMARRVPPQRAFHTLRSFGANLVTALATPTQCRYDKAILMSDSTSHRALTARRAELLAELFLQELKPEFIASSNGDFGYDFLMGFLNPKGGINNVLVEVKSTEALHRKQYVINKRLYERLAYSNTPALLLVVDVKENRFYCCLLTPDVAIATGAFETVRVELTELDEKTKKELRQRLAA
jgi:hypothetical protein